MYNSNNKNLIECKDTILHYYYQLSKSDFIEHIITLNVFNDFQLQYYNSLSQEELLEEFRELYLSYFFIINEIQKYITNTQNIIDELYVKKLQFDRSPFTLSIHKPQHISRKHFSNFILGYYNFNNRDIFIEHSIPFLPIKNIKNDNYDVFYYHFNPFNYKKLDVIQGLS